MYERTFGVEIECGYSGILRRGEDQYRDPGDPEVYNNCTNRSYCSSDQWCYHQEDLNSDGLDDGLDAAISLLRSNGLRHWADGYIHPDGSGVEIPSPVLKGEKGIRELTKVMCLLSENGFYTTNADGLHVHHGAADYVNDAEAVIRLAESWVTNEPLIESLVDARRRNHYACPRNVTHTVVDNWKERAKTGQFRRSGSGYWMDDLPNGAAIGYQGGGRGALNTAALSEHGTVEIRLHEGTLDPRRTEAWVKFGHYFMEAVARRKTPLSCNDVPTLLKRIKITPKAGEALLERAA